MNEDVTAGQLNEELAAAAESHKRLAKIFRANRDNPDVVAGGDLELAAQASENPSAKVLKDHALHAIETNRKIHPPEPEPPPPRVGNSEVF